MEADNIILIQSKVIGCPFCGKNPNVYATDFDDNGESNFIIDCCVEMQESYYYRDKEDKVLNEVNDLIAKWNRRVDSEELKIKALDESFSSGEKSGAEKVAGLLKSKAMEFFNVRNDDKANFLRDMSDTIIAKYVKNK